MMNGEMDENFRLLPQPYDRMLLDHMKRAAYRQMRNRPLPRNIDEWFVRRDKVVTQLRDSLGPMPERTPLNDRVFGILERETHVVERVVYESRPGFYVTGNVYRRRGLPERGNPAILFVHGHDRDAKEAAHVQSGAVELAKRGFVVLAIDKIGYGERRLMGHTEAYYLTMAGECLEGWQVWDNIRAIDYLTSRADVDPDRIGCTGSSGGGNQTMYTAAVEPRIKVSVAVCSINRFVDLFERGITCPCEAIPSQLQYADIPDIASTIAPRPSLYIAGIYDSGFPIIGSRIAYDEIRAVYRLFDVEDHVEFSDFFAPHDYNTAMREAMYAWFEKWLHDGQGALAPEIGGAVESQHSTVLRVLDTWPQDAESVPGHFYEKTKGMPKRPEVSSADDWAEHRSFLYRFIVEDVFGGFPSGSYVSARSLGEVDRDSITVERVLLQTEPDIAVPLLLASAKSREPGPNQCTIWLEHTEKGAPLHRRAVRKLLEQGRTLCLVEYRGIGETKGYHISGYDSEEINGSNSLVLGRHLLGMRVWDILKSIDYLRQRNDLEPDQISVQGVGLASLIALMVGALDQRVSEVKLDGCVTSLISGDGYDLPASFYPPRILQYADIVDLVSMIAPRPLRFVNPTDARRRPLSTANCLHNELASALSVYQLLDAANRLDVCSEMHSSDI